MRPAWRAEERALDAASKTLTKAAWADGFTDDRASGQPIFATCGDVRKINRWLPRIPRISHAAKARHRDVVRAKGWALHGSCMASHDYAAVASSLALKFNVRIPLQQFFPS